MMKFVKDADADKAAMLRHEVRVMLYPLYVAFNQMHRMTLERPDVFINEVDNLRLLALQLNCIADDIERRNKPH